MINVLGPRKWGETTITKPTSIFGQFFWVIFFWVLFAFGNFWWDCSQNSPQAGVVCISGYVARNRKLEALLITMTWRSATSHKSQGLSS